MNKNSVNMLSGSIFKGLLKMFIPIMIMNVITQLTNVIDMSVLGILANDNAVGAVGTCGSLITVVTGLIIAVPSGTNVVIAKHIGAGDQEKVDRALGTSIFFSLVAGVVLAIFGIVLAKPLLLSINCPDVLLEEAIIYFRLYFLGVPFLLLYNFSSAALRSVGDTKRPMYYMSACGILKILLTLFCVGVLKLTVEGVAIATIVSWLISGGLCLRILLKGHDKLKLKLKHFRFYFKELGNILYIGIPLGLQSVMYSFANVAITAEVNLLGPEATKGMSISGQYDGIMYQVAMAPSFAVLAYVSQNIAAKNYKRANRSVGCAVLLALGFGAILGGIMGLLSYPLTSIMSQDPLVIKYSQQKMNLISPLYFIHGIAEVLGAALRGMEKPIVPTITSFVFMCAIRFPWVWFVYPLFKNLTFLFAIWPIGWVLNSSVLFIVYLVTFKKVKKKIIEKINQEEVAPANS